MLTAALRKELLLQWRTRSQMMAVFVFGATSLLLFSFAIGPNAEMLRTKTSCANRSLFACGAD